MPLVWEEPTTAAWDVAQAGIAFHGQFEARVDSALQFLGNHLALTGKSRNKPVMMHCMRVGTHLRSRGCELDTVIAGILHDVLEATHVNPRMLETMFGKTVRKIVEANTVDKKKNSWQKRFRHSLDRCHKVGEQALIVRAADILDNASRHDQLGNQAKLARLCAKMDAVIESLATLSTSEPATLIYQDLVSSRTVLAARQGAQ